MIETYYIGGYWGDRKESADECACRAAGFLTGLANCDELFAKWYELGSSQKEAMEREVEASEGVLRSLLLAGRNRRDIDKTVIEKLGFGLSLWTGGEEGESANLNIKCGAHAESVNLMNNCVISLPYKGAVANRLLKVEPLIDILGTIVQHWKPDWAIVNSRNFRGRYSQIVSKVARQPMVGWILYLSSRRGQIPALPHSVSVMSIEDQGSIVVLTNERFTADKTEHIDIARQVALVLTQSNLLEPTPLVAA